VLDVVPAARLEHDAVDASRRQKVGQHEARRAGADDPNLRAQRGAPHVGSVR
jgi:hypothetical protein